MRLAFAAALWLLPLALLPLLARRPRPVRRVAVGAMQFWAAAAARDAAPLPRRLRRHWLALVQASIVAAIVLVLARPWWVPGGEVAAIVMDTSLSMAAVAGGQTRMALAAQRAAEWAAQLPAGTRLRLVTTSPAPRQVGEFPARGPALERALLTLRPSDAGARLEAAVAVAWAADPPPARVLIVTDADAPPAVAGTEWATVGAPSENAAIVTLRARRARAASPEADVIAHVRNYGARPSTTTLTLTAGTRVLLRQPLTIGPRSGVTATAKIAGPVVVTAAIDAADAIAADNTRWTVVPPPLVVRVAVIGSASAGSFLDRALRSRQGVEVVPDVERADVVVCEGCAADASPAPATAGLLIVPPVPAATPAAAPLARAGTRSQLRAPPGLEGIDAVAIDGPRPANGTVIATAGPRPAIVAFDRNGQRVVELRLDLARSPLSLTPALPILVADLIDWLSLRDLEDATFDAGATAVRPVPRGAGGPPSVIGPQGTPIAAIVEAGRLVVGDTGTAGVYRVRRGAVEFPFVVNPATSGESDLNAAAAAITLEPPMPRASAARADLTPLVLAGALMLLAIEWRMRPGPWRSRRTATALLLAAALVAPRIPWAEAPRAIVFALDVSDSMDARRAEALGFLRASTERMRGGDRAALVVFGADASVERPLDATPLAGTAPTARTSPSATNLEHAVRTARAALPGDGTGRVVLVSDGRETAGDVRREALAAGGAGVAIDVLAPRSRRSVAHPVVTRLTAPPTVHEAESFDVSATVEGAPGASTVVVFEGGAEPVRRPVTLPESGATTVAMSMRADQAGFSVYRASVESAEAFADFSGEPAGTVVAVAGGARLLYVSSAAPAAIPDGYRVERIAPEDVARNAGALSAFDVVLLDDVEPERLDETQRRALAQHVEQGGGLFVLGGPRSLVPPGGRDPLDAALPLDLRPRRGQRAPGLALVVVFDKSGSMDDRIDGAAKIEFARQAVARVLASLPPTDAVGVIAFDSEAVDVAPLRPGHEAASLAGRLDGVQPSGATAIAPAVERAVGWLRGPAAAGYARRLVLLVSDGRTSPADQARARAALRVPGIEVSTVALGDEADRRFLGELANAGNGRAFYPRRLGELPALAAREAVRVSGGHVVDERFTVQATRHPVLSGLDTSAMPVLGGYVVGSPKPGTEVALQSPLGDPVLALWRHGLGKVAVYTADLRSPWSAGLRAWRDGPALLAQTARWVSRRVDHPFLHTAMAERDGRLALTVEARGNDGGFLSGLDVRAQARTPAGEPEELALTPAGPGVYEASLALTEPGPYLFSIAAASPDGTLDARVQRGFFWTAAQERAGESDTAALAEIARASGGRVLSPNDDPFDGPRPRGRRDVAPWLGAVALLLFLSDVLRRSTARSGPGRRAAVNTSHREAA